MKILKCKPGHSIHIGVKANVDPAMPVNVLFAQKGIDIYIGYSDDQEVRVAVQVPHYLHVMHSKDLA